MIVTTATAAGIVMTVMATGMNDVINVMEMDDAHLVMAEGVKDVRNVMVPDNVLNATGQPK